MKCQSQCFFLPQSYHRVPGELRAASEPGDREERLPGERAGWEGVAFGVCAKIKGWSQRWLLTRFLLISLAVDHSLQLISIQLLQLPSNDLKYLLSHTFVGVSLVCVFTWSLGRATKCSFVFCRPAAGAGRTREAVRCNQDVRSEFAHTGQWEDGHCCSGLPLSPCYTTEQRSGQCLCQPNR